MKRNNVRSYVTSFTIFVLLLSACAAKETTPPSSSTNISPKTTALTTNSFFEEPQYGGTLTFAPLGEVGIFDWVAQGQSFGPAAQIVIESRLAEDWSRGAAGTGELKWFDNTSITPDTCMGALAESWKMPELGTFVFKVRRGVYFALNPNSEASRLMNGREVTTDDWIFSFNYTLQDPRSSIKYNFPQLTATATMEKTGPWEVTLKTPVDPLYGWLWLAPGSIFPTEVIQRYGDMHDWHNVVGTGPFMLTDYVEGSSATLSRNPDYWQTDPVGPGKGNRLPYLDAIKMLIITDTSTEQAAVRTGRIDFVTNAIDVDSLQELQANHKWEFITYSLAHPVVVFMRTDKKNLPFKDNKVRQALMLATDYISLKDNYYEGEADILGFPVTIEAGRAYMPLEEMPQSVQELYSYNPDKAKQLLAEAGYPEGFDTKLVFSSAYDLVDLASTFQAMWAKVGIHIELQPKEPGVFASIVYSRSYEEMLLSYYPYGSSYPSCLSLGSFRGWNVGYVNDPVAEATYQEIQKHILIDMPEVDRLFRDQVPYLLEQAYYIPIPTAHTFSVWWPWLKNYHGETPVTLAKYWWIDRDLKEKLTGK